MDEKHRALEARTAYRPEHAHRPKAGHSMTRIGTMQGGSQRPRLAGAIFLYRFVRYMVQTPASRVPLDIPVPNECAKLRQLFISQFCDRGLDFLHCAHRKRLNGEISRASMIEANVGSVDWLGMSGESLIARNGVQFELKV